MPLEQQVSGGFDAVAHEEAKSLTRDALVKLTGKDVERRVSSSSFSSRVFVTDCAWVPTTASASTFALCGLSNDCVCLLNVNNLSKMYLFEKNRGEGRDDKAKGDPSRRRFHLPRQVSVDCNPRLSPDGSRVTLGMIRDGAVQSCVLNTTSAVELKKLQSASGTRVLELPKRPSADPSSSSVPSLTDALFRFSPCGLRAFALLTYEAKRDELAAGSDFSYCVALLRPKPSAGDPEEGRWEAEGAWRGDVCAPSRCEGKRVCLRHFGWWDGHRVLAVWSDGSIQLYRVNDVGGLQLSCETPIFHGTMTSSQEEVRVASATSSLAELTPKSSSTGGDAADQVGLLAVAVGANCAMSFNVSVSEKSHAGDGPLEKRLRTEGARAVEGRRDGVASGRAPALHVCPTQQAFFSEDVPLRSLTLTYVFSWVVTAVLESGAVLFLDAQTMELLTHRSLKRLLSEDDEAVDFVAQEHAVTSTSPTANPKKLRCFTSNRPLNIALVEHNTIALFKPQ